MWSFEPDTSHIQAEENRQYKKKITPTISDFDEILNSSYIY